MPSPTASTPARAMTRVLIMMLPFFDENANRRRDFRATGAAVAGVVATCPGDAIAGRYSGPPAARISLRSPPGTGHRENCPILLSAASRRCAYRVAVSTQRGLRSGSADGDGDRAGAVRGDHQFGGVGSRHH